MAPLASTFLALWRNAPAFRWLVMTASAASLLAILFPPRLTVVTLGPGQYRPPAGGPVPPPIPTGPGSALLPAPTPVSVPPSAPLAPARPGITADVPAAMSPRSAPVEPALSPERRGLAPARPGFDP